MNEAELHALKRRWQENPDNTQMLEEFAGALRKAGGKPHYALIACIESNLEALETVLGDIDMKGIPDILCLGGMVGSGPNPVEVIDLVRERCRICLFGWKDGVVRQKGNWNRRLVEQGRRIKDQIRPGFFSGSQHRAR